MKILNTSENWSDFSSRLKWRFSKLTDDDLAYREDHDEDTIKRIQLRLGWTRLQVMTLLEEMKLRE